MRELARQNPGLVVITTRLTVDDLKDCVGTRSMSETWRISLPRRARRTWRTWACKGQHDELERAADEFGGHALALTLLGTYLATVHRGDVRKRDQIARLTDERRQGAHARRMMAGLRTLVRGQAGAGHSAADGPVRPTRRRVARWTR